MALEVTYKGTQIAQLTTNGNLTLETAGKYCEGNIGIAYTGGGGFDANGAVLKVVTSTGCTILVTGTNYSETHQQANGFPRSSDANVTEHFFSIPTTAFGTITVTATNIYGSNIKTLSIDTIGKIYEILCGGKNVILSASFGLQDGYSWVGDNSTYNADKKLIESTDLRAATGSFQSVPIAAFDTVTVIATAAGAQYYVLLSDKNNASICSFYSNTTTTGQITDKTYDTAKLMVQGFSQITEIIFN